MSDYLAVDEASFETHTAVQEPQSLYTYCSAHGTYSVALALTSVTDYIVVVNPETRLRMKDESVAS